MMRRRFAAGAGVVLLIVIVLIVNGCLKSQQTQALQEYAHDVSTIATESEQQVSHPLFVALSGASSKSALDVEEQVDQLHLEAQKQATQAKGLSVPGEMSSPQRNLLLALDLRAEGLEKVAGQLRTALGGQAKQANTYIAGDMENFLASDVVYSQRVVPLIEETLKSAGVSGQTVADSHFLPNVGWLDANTVQSRITGESANAAGEPVTGNHGSALKTVSVGTTALEPEPALNHISASGNTTFTVGVENSGESSQRNVKVDVTVTVGGKKLTASSVLERTEPGKTVNAEVAVTGVPAGQAAKVEVNIEGVPGENDLENNKATFLAIFGG
ncbi:MAG TPA: hypothetical protein VMG80_08290 [Solirubrobacteraceae bacterium]|nr:hypothetical protein [Solirubrobacteraceae bacterium]